MVVHRKVNNMVVHRKVNLVQFLNSSFALSTISAPPPPLWLALLRMKYFYPQA